MTFPDPVVVAVLTVEVAVVLESDVEELAVVLSDVRLDVPVVEAGVVVEETVLVNVVDVGTSVTFVGGMGPTHQHKRYCPPTAVVAVPSQVTVVPLAKTDTNKPAFPKRGMNASCAHVSSTENVSKSLRWTPVMPSNLHV
jgi:hypothetical protein